MLGCATAKDVQLATDLIRTDNELTRLLVEVRPGDTESAAVYLSGLAVQAKKEADELNGVPGKERDAIAYYRIAATAYWRSGMTEDVRKKIFNLYFTTKAKGTGIGLSIVQQIVDQHGGVISVESELGKGTTFSIVMPIRCV